MNIHEYQAKELFAKSGIPVPKGVVASSKEEAKSAAAKIGFPVVLKAQVLVGGRGKAGGIKFARTPDEVGENAAAILGMQIKGLPVRKLLVAESLDIAKEYYLGILVDRRKRLPLVMASAEGGIEIEEVARRTPEKILRLHFDPWNGLLQFQAREIAFGIEKDKSVALKIASVVPKLWRLFLECDASLAEINPLVLTKSGDVIALDAKVNLDDNALFKHGELELLRDKDGEDKNEAVAREKGLSYVKLDGNVGCVVNGAGLAMATMDLIKHFGAEPANFLDIGGSSNPDKVKAAMGILLSDKNVKAIFFNIFGGITRCDDVALGLVESLKTVKTDIPIVIRLTGTNEDAARKILSEKGLRSTTIMDEGVKDVVAKARGVAS
ncbi:MAG: ADP-forming succinate--CoA ligase subunit beta [Candidatus Eisenbacteria bacterium]|nr:ADP-forming succinate--CoA ligase subunit beta [Candidatus Eisenbacteria bacterium]